jgi:HlyD family type I secretion membrane fusion protein
MEQSLTFIRRARADKLSGPISAFESETQAVIQTTSPLSERAIVYVLVGMTILALFLMSVVKLDRVVSGSGRILPTQGSLFVQPLDRAIVTGIAAHAGDVVHKGQVLATLDPTFALADLRDMQQKKAAAEALVMRLQAESQGRDYVVDPSSPQSILQGAIWQQRQAEYRQTLADMEARVRSGSSAVQKDIEDQHNYQQRLAIASQAEDAQQKLIAQGFGRKLSLLSATDNRVEMQRMVTESQQSAAQAQHDVASLSAARDAFISKWRGDIATQLVTAQDSLSAINQSLAKASRVSDLSKLVAPADAVVLKIGKANIGSVIDPSTDNSEPLFTLTPLGGPLEAEIHIDAKDIGFIRAGDKVRLKFDAYQFTNHGTAVGVIKTISDGSFTTNDDGQVVRPFYKARVAITQLHLRNVPNNFQLTPGLTLTAETLIGRRTIMQYIFGGALRTGSEAMREPS